MVVLNHNAVYDCLSHAASVESFTLQPHLIRDCPVVCLELLFWEYSVTQHGLSNLLYTLPILEFSVVEKKNLGGRTKSWYTFITVETLKPMRKKCIRNIECYL